MKKKLLLARVSDDDIGAFGIEDIVVIGASMPNNPSVEFRYCDFTDINSIVDTIEILVEDCSEYDDFLLGSQGLNNFNFSDLASVYLSQNHLMRCLIGPYLLYSELKRIYKEDMGDFHICPSVQLGNYEKINAFYSLLGIGVD